MDLFLPSDSEFLGMRSYPHDPKCACAMKKFLKLLALLAVPTLMMTGSLTLSGCSADALTGPIVSAESGGSNNGGGSTKTGADHNNLNSNNGGGSTKTGADHNN
ncbi:hypothetical protein HRbin18_01447 [bacterium HR18]|nr:hypothetical protein HRbin18_01447 [bacterium HR18]